MKISAIAPMGRFYMFLLIASALLVFGFSSLSLAQEQRIDINALIDETQKMSSSQDEMSMVWWLPEEFWLANFAQDPSSTPEQAQQFVKVLNPYTVLCVIDGLIGTFGGVTYHTEEFIRENIYIVDEKGTRYTPIKNKDLNADTTNFLSMMKPLFVNMLGPMGENMHFYLFPSKTEDGERIAKVREYGNFTVKVNLNEYKWRLPLSSLMPPKICPEDGEKLNGAWKYCPWHGSKL